MKHNKALPALLSLGLTTGLAVNPIMAQENTATEDKKPENTDGLVLSKKAEIQEDGTYDITMTAYATGTIKTDSKTKPTDIVLVLDTSGSMDTKIGTKASYDEISDCYYSDLYNNREDLYYKDAAGNFKKITISTSNYGIKYTLKFGDKTIFKNKPNGTWSNETDKIYTNKLSRLDSLKEAATNFINSTKLKNEKLEAGEKHRISIVQFAEGSSKLSDLVEVDENNTDTLISQVNGLTAIGSTWAEAGLSEANSILKKPAAERNSAVMFLTDGDPNHGNGFDKSIATTAVNTAKEMKDKGITIFSVGVHSEANPDLNPENSSDFNKFLFAVSSTFPKATATYSKGDWYRPSSWTVSWGTRNTNNYYYAVKNSTDMDNVFEQIEEESKNPAVDLNSTAELVDILGDDFVATNDTTVSAKVQDFTGGTVESPVFSDSKAGSESLLIINTLVTDSKATVTGFDYSDNFVAIDDNGQRRGQRLTVTIEGVQLKSDNKSVNKVLYTNNSDSGIHYENEVIKRFPKPETTIAGKTVVMDYGKTVRFDQNKLGYKTWNSSFYDAGKAIDANKLSTAHNSLQNGLVNNGDYSVNTTSWNGYDSFLALGIASSENVSFNKFKEDYESRLKTDDPLNPMGNNANVEDRLWTKVSVLPASNIYYDDDFTSESATGRVGISYTVTFRDENGKLVTEADQYGVWSADGNGNNVWTDDENSNFGHEDNQKNHQGDSFGTSHTGQSIGGYTASAEFTFTGTNVDIYSHTDMNSGVVAVDLFNADGKRLFTKMINHKSEHENNVYYQVPTLSFDDKALAWGTYKVKLRVISTGDAAFVLDGIRVYNPLDPSLKDDQIVQGSHENQKNAKFTPVKDLVLAGGASAQGALFVDNNPDVEGTGNSGNWESVVYDKVGPENEVYLSKNQGVIINTNTSAGKDIKYRVALRVINNSADTLGTNVKVTNGNAAQGFDVTHSQDMYYDVTPNANGEIMIANLGSYSDSNDEDGQAITNSESNLLVITKIMAYGADAEFADYSPNVESMIAYASTFNSLPLTGGDIFVTEPGVAENEGNEDPEPEVTEPNEGTEVIDPADVTINDENENEDRGIFSWFGNLFGGFGKFFR